MLRDSIRMFKRFNLVANLDSDVTLSEARIRIFSSIMFAVPNDNLNMIYETIEEKLNRYLNGSEPNDDEETMPD